MSSARARRGLRFALPVLATVAIVAPLAWMWQASLMPAAYSVMDMGYLDYGGGAQPDPASAGHGGHGEGMGTTTFGASPLDHRPGCRPQHGRRMYGSTW